MKKTSILLLGIVISSALVGQSKKADDIINEVSQKANSLESYMVNFTFVLENPEMTQKEINKGTLLVKGEQYILEIAGQRVICDGETIWTYIKDAEEIQINAVEDDEDMITPSSIFSFYNENYKSKFIGEVSEGGKTIHIVELKPNIDRTYSRVDLHVDSQEHLPTKILVFDKNGGTITYIIDEFQSNIPVDDKKFTFKESDYPGVEIIDMR